jgi:hypothetical protein
MKYRCTLAILMRRTVSAIVLSSLVACASGHKIVNHGFGFNLSDSPEAELLASRYV